MADTGSNDLSRLTRTLVRSTDRRTRVPGVAAGLLGVGAVGAVTAFDYATGPHVSLLAAYAAVVLAAGWRSSRAVALLLAFLSAIGTATAASLDPGEQAAGAIIALNAGLRALLLAVLGVGAWLLHASLRELSSAARRDPLTGLFNRGALFEIADLERARALRTGRPLAVAYFDLDGLKTINDRDGHDAGDALISAFAQALTRGLRAADAAARLGGDEFVVVLPEADLAAARTAIARILDDPATPRASCGLVAFDRPDAAVTQLVAEADALMYEVKRAGGGLRAAQHDGTPHPG